MATPLPTKGRTGTWVNQPNGSVLFMLYSPFHETLVHQMPGVLAKVKAVTACRTLTCVFDRGGWSTAGCVNRRESELSQ
jgi:hypothetical protein